MLKTLALWLLCAAPAIAQRLPDNIGKQSGAAFAGSACQFQIVNDTGTSKISIDGRCDEHVSMVGYSPETWRAEPGKLTSFRWLRDTVGQAVTFIGKELKAGAFDVRYISIEGGGVPSATVPAKGRCRIAKFETVGTATDKIFVACEAIAGKTSVSAKLYSP